jgi:hypothetical protein
VNVAALVGVPGLTPALDVKDRRHALMIFRCLFQQAAFLKQGWDERGRTFHEFALEEARHYEEKVSQDLGQRVFTLVFPDLANALANGDPDPPSPRDRTYLEELRDVALTLLYRLLFVLSRGSRRETPRLDCRHTMEVCSKSPSYRCSRACGLRIQRLHPSSTSCRAVRSIRCGAGSITAICRFNISVRSTSGFWSIDWRTKAVALLRSRRASRDVPRAASTRTKTSCSLSSTRLWGCSCARGKPRLSPACI